MDINLGNHVGDVSESVAERPMGPKNRECMLPVRLPAAIDLATVDTHNSRGAAYVRNDIAPDAITDVPRELSMHSRRFVSVLAFAIGLMVLANADVPAQTSVTNILRDASGLLKAAESINTESTHLFGDRVNVYSGALSVSQTDVSVPGNSALPVEVSRVFAPMDALVTSGSLGDWELDLPSIGGEFATGVRSYGWSVINATGTPDQNKRCTYFGEPDVGLAETGPYSWEGFEYWQGTNLKIPGGGGGEVLWRSSSNSSQPTDGNNYPLVTKSGWQIRCLASLHASNVNSTRFAAGEGFIALGPDGTTYRFDWLVVRPIKAASRVVNSVTRNLYRSQISILPTLVTDRYGNTVTYQYNPAVPTQLQSITGSDGRQITIAYVAGSDRIQSVTVGSRIWTYGYTAGGTNYDTGYARASHFLSSVVQPDGKSWSFDLQPLHRMLIFSPTPSSCPDPKPVVYPDDRTGTMTHPSGATASLTTRGTVHGRKAGTTCTNVFSYISGTFRRVR
jgi:hypothetical protein